MNKDKKSLYMTLLRFVKSTLSKKNAKPAELQAATDLAKLLLMHLD